MVRSVQISLQFALWASHVPISDANSSVLDPQGTETGDVFLLQEPLSEDLPVRSEPLREMTYETKEFKTVYRGVESREPDVCFKYDRGLYWATDLAKEAELYARGDEGAVCQVQIKPDTKPLIDMNANTLRSLLQSSLTGEVVDVPLWWYEFSKFGMEKDQNLSCTKGNIFRMAYGVQCGFKHIKECNKEPDFSSDISCKDNWTITRFSRTDIDTAMLNILKVFDISGFYSAEVPFTQDEVLLKDHIAKFTEGAGFKRMAYQHSEVAYWAEDVVDTAFISKHMCSGCDGDGFEKPRKTVKARREKKQPIDIKNKFGLLDEEEPTVSPSGEFREEDKDPEDDGQGFEKPRKTVKARREKKQPIEISNPFGPLHK